MLAMGKSGLARVVSERAEGDTGGWNGLPEAGGRLSPIVYEDLGIE